MGISIGDLSSAVGGRAEGDLKLRVDGLAEPASAGPNDLALAFDSKFLPELAASRARAALLGEETDWTNLGLRSAILVSRPRHAFAIASHVFEPPSEFEEGVHPAAVISPAARIGAGCRIGPFTVIQRGACVGAGSLIGSNVSIGRDARIGERAVIYPGVRVGRGVVVGKRVLAHANAVLGCDGFAYELNKRAPEGPRHRHLKINSLGSVEIGDDVEIGANCAIDRGTISNTSIGSGTKLDNLCHVAHNVRIGEDCVICGQVGIAGSATIGDRAIFGGQVGVADNISVGSDVQASGASAIFRGVSDKTSVMGVPAVEISKHLSHYRHIAKLPRLAQKVRELERLLAENLKK